MMVRVVPEKMHFLVVSAADVVVPGGALGTL